MIGWPQFPAITILKSETFWLVVELFTAKQLIWCEVKEFMANTKLKKAHNLINNVFTKNTPI
jgi:hypothetical protein